MQRVLSYQTAVRVNADEMDTRDYVSKRTCVSLVLSVAFFTMICGFLLGKFVSDRHHHIRKMMLDELKNSHENQVRSALALPARHFVDNTHTIYHDKQNERLWLQFIGCMSNQKFEYAQRLDMFVDHFVDRQFDALVQCLRNLELTIDSFGNKNSTSMTTT